MSYTYQWPLVAFSVFIAIAASYTTLRLADRLTWATPRTRPYWIAGGALSMGIGIWAMHFVGMLAFHLPVPVAYDATLTALSVLPAILASAIALYVRSRSGASGLTRFLASVLMGAGIVTMHYSGMAAMQMAPAIEYDPSLFALSALIAVLASWGALFLASPDRTAAFNSFQGRLASSVAMGLAIAGMHYTGMAAAEFAPGSVCTVADSGLAGSTIGLFVGLFAVLVLAISLALTFFDEVLGENTFFKTLLAAQSDAGEGVLLIEKQKVIFANPAMMSLSGYSETELQSLPAWSALFEGEVTALPRMSEQPSPAASATTGRREMLLKTRLGARRTCEVVLSAFRHAETIRHLLVCIDISDRKAAEEALQASEANARELALVASITDNAVIIMDAEARITWVNEGFSKMCGYALEEVLGRRPGELLNGPTTDPATLQYISDHLSRGERFETEIVHYRKTGKPYWAVVDVQPVYGEAGEAVKYISIERDITSRKEAEAALRLSEARLTEAQELAHIGSWELDLLADEYVLSEEALRIHGLVSTDGRVSRESLAATVHADDLVQLRQRRKAAVQGLGTYAMQARLVSPEGRIKHVQIRGAVHSDDRVHASRVIGTVQDISEQTMAEQALREREAQASELAMVASRTDNAVIMSDAKGRITWVNDGFTRMTGYSLAEVQGRSPARFLHGPDTDPGTVAYIREQLIKGENFEAQVLHYRKNGDTYWVEIDVQCIRDEAGVIVKYISIERDVSRRKETEAALRESESRLKEAQRLAKVGSWYYEFGADRYHMSEEALRIHEFQSTDGFVSRQDVGSRVHPDDRELLRQSRDEALDRKEAFSIQVRLLLPDGRIKYVHLRGAVNPGQRGKAGSVSGTIQDVSEQKLAEEALRQLNETLEQRVHERTDELDRQRAFIETILNTAETLIFVVDNHGRFVRFNGACERLTGYGFEEVRGQPIWESVITPERRREVRLKHENPVYADRLADHLEVEWMARDGRRRLISWNNAMISDEAGRLEYMIGTGIDITERKRAEQNLIVANQNLSRSIDHLRQTQSQLVQAEKMAALGGLVAGISHEINTPIGIGVTSATALHEELDALQKDFEAGTMKRSTLAQFIAHSQEGYAILVRNLMRAAELIRSFKQVAVDQSSDESRDIDLARYIDEVVLSLQPRFRGSRIKVVNSSASGLIVHTHPGAIYQILSNLLINALVHAYEPGQPGVIRITASQVGEEVQMDCADDGKGIPADIQGQIFDPFFTTRRGSGGSGLGLHIVFNQVATTLNGRIQLVHGVEKGATFRILFPLISEQQHVNS